MDLEKHFMKKIILKRKALYLFFSSGLRLVPVGAKKKLGGSAASVPLFFSLTTNPRV